MKSGIYRIIDEKGREYIGSTYDFNKRGTQHFSDLKRGKHHNIVLQRVYAKYGRHYFKFEPLLYCKKKYLEKIEQLLLLEVNSYYNLSTDVYSPMRGRKHSEKTKQKIREAAKLQKREPLTREHKQKLSASHRGKVLSKQHKQKLSNKKMGKNNPRSRSVVQIDNVTGEVVRKYALIKETEDYGFTTDGVSKCCRGIIKAHGGFLWRYSVLDS